MGDLGEWVGLGGYTPEQWQAVGTMATAFIALAAAVFAWQQVRHARKLREEQAQPYVVVDFESSRNILINLVVRNTGLTVAHDVKLTFDPPLISTFDDTRKPTLAESLFIVKGIPTMPPGRTWAALYERGPDRYARDDLPRAYDVTVTYRDSQGRKYSLPYRLDLDIFFGIRNVGLQDIHDVSQDLRKIRETVARWTEGLHGLSVFTRDGEAKDKRQREEMDEINRRLATNRREDGSVISEWTELQMSSDWVENKVAVDHETQLPPNESITRRFRKRGHPRSRPRRRRGRR
ncbi:hypothetical protein GCM10009744_07400 [Kribbella alba]|uniref:Uncharacterized protein n=1 Tax=Kribbella alba TaxID=190197 RepID=A0ABP4QU64_9ACTN